MPKLEEEKLKYVFKMKLDIRWSDMDEMRHVNNAVYLTYFEQARIFYFQEACQWNWQDTGVILASAHVDYLRPVVFPDPAYVYVRTSKLGNKSLVLDYLITTVSDNTEQLATTGYTTMVLFDYEKNQSTLIPDFLRAKITAYESNL